MEDRMHTVVQKWGNSLGVRIPNLYVREFKLQNGSPVDIVEEGGRLIIKPGRLSLEELLARVTPENRHDPVETGPSLGREDW